MGKREREREGPRTGQVCHVVRSDLHSDWPGSIWDWPFIEARTIFAVFGGDRLAETWQQSIRLIDIWRACQVLMGVRERKVSTYQTSNNTKECTELGLDLITKHQNLFPMFMVRIGGIGKVLCAFNGRLK